MLARCCHSTSPPQAMPSTSSTGSWYTNQVPMGKVSPAQQEPRDTYFVSAVRTRNPPHTSSAMRQSIIMATVPPERMPLPPLKWNMQGNMWPSRQNTPAQYLAKVTPQLSQPPATGATRAAAMDSASTAFSTSQRMTTAVSGPPKVR